MLYKMYQESRGFDRKREQAIWRLLRHGAPEGTRTHTLKAREPKGDVTLVTNPYSVVIVPFSNSFRSLNISKSLWIPGKISLSNCVLIDLTDTLSPAVSRRLPAFNMAFAPLVPATWMPPRTELPAFSNWRSESVYPPYVFPFAQLSWRFGYEAITFLSLLSRPMQKMDFIRCPTFWDSRW